jgi:hypothetical protein
MSSIKVKTVTAEELTRAYQTLFPQEVKNDSDFQETERILGNWLKGYVESPELKLATTNWCGKVTKALFLALNIKMPKTKKDMLVALEEEQVILQPAPVQYLSEEKIAVVSFTRTVTMDMPAGSDEEAIKLLATDHYNSLDPEGP